MSANTLELDCHFCSVISKANVQDPIGSAGTYEHWIIAEIPQPWNDAIWTDHPIVAPASQLIETLEEDQGMQIRSLMIAPDSGTDRFANRKYSQSGKTQLLYYRRPATLFAEFDKRVEQFRQEQILARSVQALNCAGASPVMRLKIWRSTSPGISKRK